MRLVYLYLGMCGRMVLWMFVSKRYNPTQRKGVAVRFIPRIVYMHVYITLLYGRVFCVCPGTAGITYLRNVYYPVRILSLKSYSTYMPTGIRLQFYTIRPHP